MRESVKLTRADIQKLLELLNGELERSASTGEVFLVGGAVMCLVFNARPATRDVDALFKPAALLREAAARVAVEAGVPATWLNDAVKAYLSPHGDFDPFMDMSNLKVYIAQPSYLLAMKCAAMRLGEEFHDLDDVRFLLRFLNITTAAEALVIVSKYYDEDVLPLKTRLALEEILE